METLIKMPYEIWSCDRESEIWIVFEFAMKESESRRVASGGVCMLTEHRSNVSLSILNVFSFMSVLLTVVLSLMVISLFTKVFPVK